MKKFCSTVLNTKILALSLFLVTGCNREVLTQKNISVSPTPGSTPFASPTPVAQAIPTPTAVPTSEGNIVTSENGIVGLFAGNNSAKTDQNGFSLVGGFADGSGTGALFQGPSGLTIDISGN